MAVNDDDLAYAIDCAVNEFRCGDISANILIRDIRKAIAAFDDQTPTEYLIWSEEHRSWWRPHSRGYTDQMPQAGRYPAHVAAQIVRDANIGGRFNECAVPIDAHMRAILARAE